MSSRASRAGASSRCRLTDRAGGGTEREPDIGVAAGRHLRLQLQKFSLPLLDGQPHGVLNGQVRNEGRLHDYLTASRSDAIMASTVLINLAEAL